MASRVVGSCTYGTPRRYVGIADHGVAHRRTSLSQQLRQVCQEAAADDDVVGRVAPLDERDADPHHFTSGRPATALAERASTNSRSESRFRYWSTPGEAA